MNYEKKYKEALGWMRSVYPTMTGADKEDAEHFFPELKESEESDDERIRKRIIHALHGDVLDMEETTKAIAWLENQGMSYTKKDVDDAYLKGVTDTKDEIEKQYKATYQIRKDIATFIFNYKGDIKDRAKWMDYLGVKVSFVEKQGEQELLVTNVEKNIHPIIVKKTGLGRCAVEHEQKSVNKVEPIPIIAKILEKNGFMANKHVYPYPYYEYTNEENKVKLGFAFPQGNRTSYKEPWIYIDTENVLIEHLPCIYVHQLQNILRLCGIEKEIIL